MEKSRKNSIAKNIGHLFYSTALSSALNALALILLANYLQSYHYGLFSVALAFAMIMGYFTDAGLSDIVLREGSKKEVSISILISSYIKMRGALLLGTFAVGFMLIVFLNPGNRELLQTAFYLIIPLVMGISLQSIGITYFQLMEKMQYCGLIRIVSSIILVSALGAGFLFHFNPIIFCLLYGLSYFFAGLFSLYLLRRNVRIDLKCEFHQGLLQNLGSFMFAGLLFVMLPHIGPIILEKTISLNEVGLFAVAYRIPQALQQIPFIVAGAFYPVLFKAFNSNLIAEHLKLLHFQTKLMALVGILMTIPFYHLSGFIVSILFGEEWADAGFPLKILSLLLFLQAISIALADGLTTSRKQFQRMVVQGISVFTGIILYFLLSKTYAVTGAAMAGVIMESVALLGFWLCSSRRWVLAKNTLIPYLVFTLFSLLATDFFFNQIPFLALAINVLLVVTVLLVDKEMKNKLFTFFKSKNARKTFVSEGNQEA